MILKLKGFYLQNGGSFQNLPSPFDWNKLTISEQNHPTNSNHQQLIKKTTIIRPKEIKKKHLLRSIKLKFSTFTNLTLELGPTKEEVRGLGKKKSKEIEWVLLEKPIKKIKVP